MYSLVIPNKIPLSQNARHNPTSTPGVTQMDNYKAFLIAEFDKRYPTHAQLTSLLYGKVFWIHKTGDRFFHSRDADNFSKPLWDALNLHVYQDDKQIRLRQAAKLQHGDTDSLTVDVTNMDDTDYSQFLSFHLDSANTHSNWLYIELGDFKHSQVKFGEL